jgi:hypothetical protein
MLQTVDNVAKTSGSRELQDQHGVRSQRARRGARRRPVQREIAAMRRR